MVAYDQETIDNEEFVSRNPSFQYKHYEEFDFETMDPVQCKAEFRVEKNALRSVMLAGTPDLRHRILHCKLDQ